LAIFLIAQGGGLASGSGDDYGGGDAMVIATETTS
jgi:hypothetical protein